MAEHGHVKVSRKFYADDPLWKKKREFSEAEAWLDLIQRAAWKDHERMIGSQVVKLARGEVLGSLRFLAEAWGWKSPGKVKRFLELLVRMDRISEQRTEQQGTVYILVNYELYQSTPEETKQHAKQQRNSNGTATEQREAVKAGKAGKSDPTGSGGAGGSWMWKLWQAEFGREFPNLEYTKTRRQKFAGMFNEHLHDKPDPKAAFAEMLRGIRRHRFWHDKPHTWKPEVCMKNAEKREEIALRNALLNGNNGGRPLVIIEPDPIEEAA